VKHKEAHLTDPDAAGGRQGVCPDPSVDVSADCNCRRDRAKRFEHARIADISSMQNQLGSAQSVSGLRPKKAMRV
jgi:hypothetical protein